MTDLINVTVADGKYTIRETESGRWEKLRYGEPYADRRPDNLHIALAIEVDQLLDKVDGLSSDLDSAVEVAFRRGAVDWVRLNYPAHFERLSAGDCSVQQVRTDRGWFAGQALPSVILTSGTGKSPEDLAAICMCVADAMVDALNDIPAVAAVTAPKAYDEETTKRESEIEGMIQYLLARGADRINIVDDFPNRCGLDLPMNEVDDGEMLEVATLSHEDSGYAPTLWRLAIAVLKSRRAEEEMV